MNNTFNFRKNLIIFGMPFLITGIVVFIATSNVFSANPSILSVGIIFDLLFTVPLVYFLLIRKTNVPKTTVVPFLILGIIICSLILPAENQYYLNLFKTWVLPIVEVFILSFVIVNVVKGIKRFKRNSAESVDFFTTLKSTCYEILPEWAVIPVVTEIAVFFYGFVHWKSTKLKENEFSYHKDSGTISLLIAIIFIVAIETFVLHNLLLKWNITVAWVLTVLSIYSGIQLFGFLKSMSKRPMSLKNNKLFLRYGIMNETIIELKNIKRIEVSSKDLDWNQETRKLSFLGALESHNVIIYLKEENTLTGLYGSKKTYKTLALYVDNKIEFVNKIKNNLQKLC